MVNPPPPMELIQHAAETLAKAQKLMEVQAKDLEAKQARWQEQERRVLATLASAPNLITLNVGGTPFTVPKETLLRVEGSYFYAMLGSGHWKPDNGNAFFLDLHAATFDRILTYLRTGKLWLDGLSKGEVAQVRASMEYLQLASSTSWDPAACSTHMDITNDMKTVTTSTLGKGNSVIGLDPVTSFSVRVEAFGPSNYVGLSPRPSFKLDGAGNRGYYVRLSDGYTTTHVGFEDRPSYGNVFTPGDVVTVRVSSDEKIHFERNGQELGVAFTITDPDMALYPAVTMYSRGRVTFVA
ncbi:Aste57867_11845 [Aphanomyces stellatus]|uniref:Aste57867_11845 protein n=1 Tax=Aphanomyces stellatus TaxID=120398 RepID=A0A485KUJ4_9STRA|nr:hypothetical protein As57867_011800 [Aphanomyces stellatus]VFT88700.1 Aste57867_11845 [Aphanomyces stellatus]